MALTCVHMGSTFLLCNAFYLIRPDFYPTMQQTEGKRLQLLAWFCPLAVLFAVGLFCSNQAYMYCSPAFLQFMKEGNVVLVFVLSCIVGLQVCTRARFVNIVWILAGASMAVSGQVHFVMTGFVFQLVSQFGECGKNVMGDWMMKSHLKLDALTYTMFLSPMCLIVMAVSGQVHFIMAGFVFQLVSQFGECGKNVMGDWMMKSHLKLDALTYTMFLSPMCLIVLMVGAAVTWKDEILTDFAAWWMFIIPNGCLAFTMNVTVSLLIKECSAFAFILAGLVKDAVIVVCGAGFLGETVVAQQYMGFFVCLSGVFFWSYSRIDPHAPLVQFFQSCCLSEHEGEKMPLLAKTEKGKEQSSDDLTMFLSPMCLIVLMVGAAVTWNADILTDFAAWWMFIIPNGCLAFTMNVTVSLLIKECSAFAFILAGLVKDAVVVICGAGLLGETVVAQQYMGFFVCLSGVFFWSYSRIDPRAPLVQIFQNLCFSEHEGEKTPLLPKTEKAKEQNSA
eukprot:CAMPEP_0194549832 /NCGR_PEP_ID=MMETSP0253-20130528/95404_1 /TAXON_ID=2966 /ORGANISM="Noctiluca scintillans" /LENGTH=503 /DNA_ID=CAMNT_0039397265 /DNA_START=480 /DNA_END=1992 /DNA_ORIENTATION=+